MPAINFITFAFLTEYYTLILFFNSNKLRLKTIRYFYLTFFTDFSVEVYVLQARLWKFYYYLQLVLDAKCMAVLARWDVGHA